MRTNLRLPAIPVVPCIDPFFQPGGEATALKIISTTECSCGHAVTPRVWTTEPASPEPPGEPSIGSCTSGELAKQDSRLAGCKDEKRAEPSRSASSIPLSPSCAR
jgi:hypothetical protein